MKRIFILTTIVGLSSLTLNSCKFKNESENHLTVRCELLCDEEHGKFPDKAKLLKYKKWYPYDTTQKTDGDSVTLSFDFITDCCLAFTGAVNSKKDTLELQYFHANDSTGCDCYCDYRMIYKLKVDSINWSALKIVNTDGNKPQMN